MRLVLAMAAGVLSLRLGRVAVALLRELPVVLLPYLRRMAVALMRLQGVLLTLLRQVLPHD